MRLIAIAAALALVPALAACGAMRQLMDPAEPVSLAETAILPETLAMPGHVEPVHAAVIAQNQAAFWVSSNGCTAKADIQPVVRQSHDGPIITLRRIKEDRCRQVQPEGVEMRWSFEELGLENGSRLSVENPYQLPPG